MRSNIGRIVERTALNLAESGTPIVLKWKTWQSVTVDPTTKAKSGTATEQTETVQAFLHFVGASSVVRQFAEIKVGDCIVDLHQDLNFEGRDALRFIIDGEEYSMKPMSDELTSTWNTMVAGRKIFKTVLLRKGT